MIWNNMENMECSCQINSSFFSPKVWYAHTESVLSPRRFFVSSVGERATQSF